MDHNNCFMTAFNEKGETNETTGTYSINRLAR